jgi:hypothetical protein
MSGEQSPPLTPREGGPEDGTALPKPDLSPLTNPTLGRNLGKWAQVYFTNPPETRNVALSELLRELEGTGGPDQAQKETFQPPRNGDVARASAADTLESSARTGTFSCPQCARNNAPDQLFCGHCGFPLRARATGLSTATKPTDGGAVQTSPLATSRMSDAQHTDLQWLRERSLASFRNRDTASHSFRSLLIIVLILGFAGLFYHYWQAPAATPSRGSAESRARREKHYSPASAVMPAQPQNPMPFSERQVATVNEAKSSPARSESHKPASLQASRSTEKASLLASAAENDDTASSSNGQHEFEVAQTYLGRQKARDPGEAAKWLWKSVAKHNARALVQLADLYERGEGVSKSCDQAEVLLVAAAKRGSIAAGDKLRRLQASGCK